MNKSIPTALGIAIILLVVILVVSMYNMTMLTRLSQGETVVGTTAQKVLGGPTPEEEISPHEALAAHMTAREGSSPTEQQRKGGKTERVQTQREKREARQASRRDETVSGRRPGGG